MATTLPVPAKPTGLSKTLTVPFGSAKYSLEVTWTNPNNATISKYQYRLKDGSGNYGDWTDISNSTKDTTSLTLTGLTRNALQTISIRATNGLGNGVASDELPVLPAQATGLAAEGRNEAAELRWTNPSDATITQWQFRLKAGSAEWEDWGNFEEDVTTVDAQTYGYTMGQLVNYKTYKFRVRALNPAGDGAASGEASAVPAVLPGAAPNLAASLTAGTGTAYNLKLTWTKLADPTIVRWEYRTQPAGGTYGADWTHVAGGGTATTLALNGQARSSLKELELRAVNSIGNGAAAKVLLVPDTPNGFAAVARDRSASLSWTDPEHALIAKYQYQQKTSGGWTNISWTDMSSSSAATTSHTVASLTNGTAYTYRIRAWNLAGESSASAEASATPLPVPSKPTGLTATATANGSDFDLALEWTKPSGLSVGQWQYQTRGGGGYGNRLWVPIANSTKDTTTHTLTGQARNTWRGIRIRVVNTAGGSPASDEVDLALAAPTGLAAAGKDQAVDLSWADPGDATIAGYEYQQKATGDWPNDWTSMSGSTAATTSHTVGSLTNLTTYAFRIRAANAVADSAASATVSATPALAPAKPAGLAATLAASGSNYDLRLTWTALNNASVTGWEYQTRTGSDYSGRSWTAIGNSATDTTTHTLAGQARNTWTGIRIRAANSTGPGAESDEVLLVPARPTGLTASTGNKAAVLQWADPDDALIAKHQYQQRTGNIWGNVWTDMPNSGSGEANATSYAVGGLANGTTYSFRIRAASLAGEGAASGAATATPNMVPERPAGP